LTRFGLATDVSARRGSPQPERGSNVCRTARRWQGCSSSTGSGKGLGRQFRLAHRLVGEEAEREQRDDDQAEDGLLARVQVKWTINL